MINISKSLFHKNIFNKSAIEENIFDIKLPKRSFICKGNRKHNTDNDNFDNRIESVNVAETRYLSITFGNKTSFETLDGSIKQIFNMKYSFRASRCWCWQGEEPKSQCHFVIKLEFLHPWQQPKHDSKL